ncbi:MAG: hypothetical protein ACLUHD_15555, partial [Eggerthella lenta]
YTSCKGEALALGGGWYGGWCSVADRKKKPGHDDAWWAAQRHAYIEKNDILLSDYPFGKSRVAANARFLHAFAIDLDGVGTVLGQLAAARA